MVVSVWHMPRATASQKATRLNLAWQWLRRGRTVSEASRKLAAVCDVSPRQAYRYVEQAQRLTDPVPVEEPKIPFTVKLSARQVKRLHRYAAFTGTTLSQIVSQALWAVLKRGGKRG